MEKKKIFIIILLFVAVAGFTLSNVSAVEGASNTVKIYNKDWKGNWNYIEKTPMDKYVIKKSGNFRVQVNTEYQRDSKKWAIKNKPKSYFKGLTLYVSSKKKFKSATFYLHDDKTGNYKKKLTYKAKSTYLEPGLKGYDVHKVYWMNHRYTCKKVVIKY
nr:hypothetical protein [Methanobrevibacter arboriphilus]